MRIFWMLLCCIGYYIFIICEVVKWSEFRMCFWLRIFILNIVLMVSLLRLEFFIRSFLRCMCWMFFIISFLRWWLSEIFFEVWRILSFFRLLFLIGWKLVFKFVVKVIICLIFLFIERILIIFILIIILILSLLRFLWLRSERSFDLVMFFIFVEKFFVLLSLLLMFMFNFDLVMLMFFSLLMVFSICLCMLVNWLVCIDISISLWSKFVCVRILSMLFIWGLILVLLVRVLVLVFGCLDGEFGCFLWGVLFFCLKDGWVICWLGSLRVGIVRV